MLLAIALSCVSPRRKVLAGEDDDGHVVAGRARPAFLEQLEAGHVGQPQVEHHAVEGSSSIASSASPPVPTALISMSSWPSSSTMTAARSRCPRRPAAAWCAGGEVLDAVERRFQALGGRRLDEIGEGAVREAVLALLLQRDDLHRNVPRGGSSLSWFSTVQPSMSGRKISSEMAAGGTAARGKGRWRPCGDDALEALVARQAQQDARVVRVVLDDEQHGSPRR
jgi:hypothetical protein